MSCWHTDSGSDGTRQMACHLLEIDSVGRSSCCSSVVCLTGFWRAGAGSWWLKLLCLFRALGWGWQASPGAVQGDIELSGSHFLLPLHSLAIPNTQLEFDTRLFLCRWFHSVRAEEVLTGEVGWHPTESLPNTMFFLAQSLLFLPPTWYHLL